MEYLDICGELGNLTGQTASRETVHRKGLLHRTSHVWVIRKQGERYQVLLQKRSKDKDSFPGMYDASSAGHIPAGAEPLASILREMEEEIGIRAIPAELTFIGSFRCDYQAEFHGQMFHDNEIRFAYVYETPVEITDLTLQESEVEEVRWFDVEAVFREIRQGSDRICITAQGFELLLAFLKNRSLP